MGHIEKSSAMTIIMADIIKNLDSQENMIADCLPLINSIQNKAVISKFDMFHFMLPFVLVSWIRKLEGSA